MQTDYAPVRAADTGARNKHSIFRGLTCVIAAVSIAGCNSNSNSDNSVDNSSQRVSRLVEQMTLEEKVLMLHGSTDSLAGAGAINGNERLGIPTLRLTDGPAGARSARYLATAMPAPVSLAASFNPDLAYDFGAVIGKEGQAQQQHVLLSPMTNIVRAPQAGRNFETFGEDPWLAGQIVAAEVKGVQNSGLMATIKHYVVNNQETNRMTINTVVDEQALRELYLPAFKQAIDAGAAAVMCAYNKVAINGENSEYACANETLLTDILKDEWGFTGFVMTDWYAGIPGVLTPDAAPSPSPILAGLDVEMPGDSMFGELLLTAVNEGDIAESYVDISVSRILTQMSNFGLLDDNESTTASIDTLIEEHADIAKKAALQGAVLLKNDNSTLPLTTQDTESLLVIGATGAVLNYGGGGSSRVKPLASKMVSPLNALESLVDSAATVTYLPGIDPDGVVIPTSALTDTNGNPGLQRTEDGSVVTTDATINFIETSQLAAHSSLIWTGFLTAPETGTYDIKIQAGNGTATLLLNDGDLVSLDSSGLFDPLNSVIATRDGLENSTVQVELTAGTEYAVTITATAGELGITSSQIASVDDPMSLKLAWTTPSQRQTELDTAVAAATNASAVIVFVHNEGTEGVDRATLALPHQQDDLVAAVASQNGKTTVVLNTGDPVTMPWEGDVSAILEMWYPGQAGGEATAEILLGLANPSGKLPVTFPASLDDLPATNPLNFPGVDGELIFDEGIYVGYRWYDNRNIEPLYPFGHGLSYSEFAYSDAVITATDTGHTVSFSVTNIGSMAGADIPQVYLSAPSIQTADFADRKLVGFDRVELAVGETTNVSLSINEKALQYWSTDDHAWQTVSGDLSVYLGHSSRDYTEVGTLTLE